MEPDGFFEKPDMSYLTYKVFIKTHSESIAVSLVSVFNVPYILIPSADESHSLGFYSLSYSNFEIYVKLDRAGDYTEARFLFLAIQGEIKQTDKELALSNLTHLKSILVYFSCKPAHFSFLFF